MTTVVWVKGKLVSDSMRTRNGTKVNAKVRKILTPAEGEEWKIMGRKVIAFGRAGMPGVEPFLTEALACKEGITHRTDLKIPSKLNFTAIVIDEFHNGWLLQGAYKQGPNIPDSFILTQCLPPTAIGSGGIYVDTALRMGKSVKKALKLAKDMDPHTGGKTQVVKLPKAVKHT
jgi:hypothetical protein